MSYLQKKCPQPAVTGVFKSPRLKENIILVGNVVTYFTVSNSKMVKSTVKCKLSVQN